MISIPMPCATRMYFDSCDKIDHHNRICKLIGIDIYVGTNSWSMRVNLGILSMMFTDAHLLFKACRGHHCDMSPRDIFEQLATELIDIRVEEGMKTCCYFTTMKSTLDAFAEPPKQLTTTKRKPGTNHASQRKCSVCKKHTTTVCSRCIATPQNDEVFVCGVKKNKKCWVEHLHTVHSD